VRGACDARCQPGSSFPTGEKTLHKRIDLRTGKREMMRHRRDGGMKEGKTIL